jgi:uncharacterized protein
MPVRWDALGPSKQHFLIYMEAGALFYAPLAHRVFLISEDLARLIVAHFASTSRNISDDERLRYLASLGVFEIRRTPSEAIAKSRWQPTSLTISTTQKCTLRCRYCYAEGGRMDDSDIPTAMTRDAIALVVSNARALKQAPRLNFIGEGEATANWQGFTYAVSEFRERCKDHSLPGTVSLSTNGVMGQKQVAFVISEIDSISVSLDGLAHVHDRNRILPNGKGSSRSCSRQATQENRWQSAHPSPRQRVGK